MLTSCASGRRASRWLPLRRLGSSDGVPAVRARAPSELSFQRQRLRVIELRSSLRRVCCGDAIAPRLAELRRRATIMPDRRVLHCRIALTARQRARIPCASSQRALIATCTTATPRTAAGVLAATCSSTLRDAAATRGRLTGREPELVEQAVQFVERAERDRDLALLAALVRLRCTRISTGAVSASDSCFFDAQRCRATCPCATRSSGGWRPRCSARARPASRPRARSASCATISVALQDLLRAVAAAAARARGPCRCRRPSASAAPARPGCSRRSRLLAALRERPTACAACSCVSLNSSTRRCRPCASSSGLRSSRWMFSISAITAAASSGTSLHQHRHLVQPGQPGGAEAALAGDDLVAGRRRRPAPGAPGSAASRPGS